MAPDAGNKQRFELPSAPPGHYLRWLAFFREVEQKMGESPSLESAAAEKAAPFVRDEVAGKISTDLIPQVVSQAQDAHRRGDLRVAPVIEADSSLVRLVVEYVATRGAFLTKDVVSAMGIEPLEEKLVRLRVDVVMALKEQLGD